MITEAPGQFGNHSLKNVNNKANDKLTSEDYLNMYLKELSLQDPLDPMDSGKMLEQTMQMTQIEQSTTQIEKTDEMLSVLNKSYMQQFTSLVGKEVNTANKNIELKEQGSEAVFNFYNDTPIKNGTAYVSDTNGDVIATISLENVTKGGNALLWNGNTLDGTPAPAGQYEIFFSAVSPSNQQVDIIPGRFKVESVLIQDGKTIINIGNDKYINLEEIYEFL